jgi:hypothetical protein
MATFDPDQSMVSVYLMQVKPRLGGEKEKKRPPEGGRFDTA